MTGIQVLQAALGLTLLAAAVAKLIGSASPTEFLRLLGLSPSASRLVAAALPAVEIVVGAGVLLGLGPAPALAALLLGLGFVGVLVAARIQGLDRACRCFGVLDADRSTPLALVRAAAVAGAAAALCGLLFDRGELTAAGPVELATGALLAAAVLAAIALAERIWLFRQQVSALHPSAQSRPEVVR